MVRQACTASRKQARVKTGRTSKREQKRQEHGENTLVDLEHTIRTGTDRQKTGLNTQRIMGTMGDTWRWWRLAQGQVKQIKL
jgi:hypothetical protein